MQVKKSLLRRIVDFFDRIIEAIKDTIQNGELSKTAREFAQMQADKAAQIREMFLDALDGIDGKKRKNTGSETKDSRKKSYVSRDGHFLSYRETGGSDAHEQAVRWAAQNDVENGDQRLAYCREAWYIIEKDSNDYAGYQVIEKIRKGEFNDERGRVEERNRENRSRTVSGEFVKYDFGNQQSNTTSDRRYGSDVDGFENQTANRRVLPVDRTSSQRGKAQIGSGQNTFGGDENRTRNGTERLTDSEVKNKAPTANNPDIRYSLKGDFSKDTLQDNLKKVAKMESVSYMDGTEFEKGNVDLLTQVEQYFNSLDNVVKTPYGNVIINRKGIRASLGHGVGRNKAIAFKAVPEVLKNGLIIDYQKNRKNRGYNTAVISAPVVIGNDNYYMAVVVVEEPAKNTYYLHEVVLSKKTEASSMFKTGTEKSRTPSTEETSVFSLLRNLQDVNISNDNSHYSLRHSLGISDNTAEVASYYGFAAVFAALVASEAADVVDSALAAVVEFVAAALDVAVDSSAEKVPAVEDNSAKADEVSLELSAGNDVESVDELFCVPFNLKAFKKPFTPRPK